MPPKKQRTAVRDSTTDETDDEPAVEGRVDENVSPPDAEFSALIDAAADASPEVTRPQGLDTGAIRSAEHTAKLERFALIDSELAAPPELRSEPSLVPGPATHPDEVSATGTITRPDHTEGEWSVAIEATENHGESRVVVSGVGIGGHRGFARLFPGDQHVPFDWDGDTHTLEIAFVVTQAIVNVDGAEIRTDQEA